MTYTLTQWKQCVMILKAEPDKPSAEIAKLLELDCFTCWALIFDVVTIWKIHRRVKFMRTKRQKEVYLKEMFINEKG